MSSSKLPKFSSILTFVLISGLILTWTLSLRPIRLYIGDYYYKQEKYDNAVNWYKKVLRKDLANSLHKNDSPFKCQQVLLKIKNVLFSQAQHYLYYATNHSALGSIDLASLDLAIRQYERTRQLFEHYQNSSKLFPREINLMLEEIIKESEMKTIEVCFTFGNHLVNNRRWQQARIFFTKEILKYLNPVFVLGKLGELYGTNLSIIEKVWGKEIFVTIEDFEQSVEPKLIHWLSSTEPLINSHFISSEASRSGTQSEYFDLSYNKEGYDYWVKSVNIPLANPHLTIGVRFFLMAKGSFKGFLKINVSYPKDKTTGLWQTDIKRNSIGKWEETRIDNLFEKGKAIAIQQNWSVVGMTVDKIILDTQGSYSRFYIDDIELYLINLRKSI